MKHLLRVIIKTGVLLIVFFTQVYTWGNSGHKLIHRKAVIHLPSGMNFFKAESLFFEEHSVDANSRIVYSDTSLYAEWPRHYFKLDDYPNYNSITHNLDSLIMRFGRYRVQQDGTNPWATKWLLDSLTSQLSRRDISAAMFTASDLAHYVSDVFEPLHCTINSDGQFTNNHGIHFRYEWGMIDTFKSEINIHQVSVQYINTPIDFAFNNITSAKAFVSQIMFADNYSKLASGWNGVRTPPRAYYDTLWYLTRGFTKNQFQNSSSAIASLWYTAWVNSGMNSVKDNSFLLFPNTFILGQNYPNPFNSSTNICYQLLSPQIVTLSIFDVLGHEIKLLISEYQGMGNHVVRVNSEDLSSGIYYYRITAGNQNEAKKFSLIK